MRLHVKTALRYTWIILSFLFIANGIVFLVRAQIGVSPWDVLHLGISYRTGISLGRVIQGVGLLVVLVSWLFHVQPRFVTLLNMIFIGYFVDVVSSMSYIPSPEVMWLKFVSYLVGVVICGTGIALYISGNRGAGPRDSLMMVMSKTTRLRVGVIRTIMEVTVATIGYFLGGPLGIGTLLFALLIGVFVELGFAGIAALKRTQLFLTLWQDLPKVTEGVRSRGI